MLFIRGIGVDVRMSGCKRKKVTIVDVAELAGVSKTTISRYLNGKYEYMSEQSRARIAEVIEELGYRPSLLARSLKSQYRYVLGVVAADITDPYCAKLLKGIAERCSQCGYRILFGDSAGDSSKEQEYIQDMLDQSVDGILLDPIDRKTALLWELGDNEGKLVVMDRTDSAESIVEMGRLYVDELLRCLGQKENES